MLKLQTRGGNGATQKERRRGWGEREDKTRYFSSFPLSLSLPLPLSFFCPSTYPKGYCFYSSLIFLRHKIKDGGYNKMNINKQLSPAKNMPALQLNRLMLYISKEGRKSRSCLVESMVIFFELFLQYLAILGSM